MNYSAYSDRVRDYLSQRDTAGERRVLIPDVLREGGGVQRDGRWYTDFSSNDYLGLSWHPLLIDVAQGALQQYGMGSTGSRLLSGDHHLFHELESELGRWVGGREALVFNSGYQANVGLLSALLGRGDVVFSDRLCHASLLDGIRLSGAKHYRFRHNDLAHLHQLLTEHAHQFRSAWIVTESIFSMDGDMAPLAELVALKKTFSVGLIVDEAHSIGLYGPNGAGMVATLPNPKAVDVLIGTFGKSVGASGAFVATDSDMKSYLVNACRSFIYSTAMPLPTVAWVLAAIRLMPDLEDSRRTLFSELAWFRDRLRHKPISVLGDGLIVPLVFGSNERVIRISNRFKEAGFWVIPVRYPTVPKESARCRITVTSHHGREQLAAFLDALDRVLD